MKLQIADHRNAAKIIPKRMQAEVKAAITRCERLDRATSARTLVLETLRNKRGWSDKVVLSSDAGISIPARKDDIGLCLQTGNMGRFYADLLKLEFLFKRGAIQAAFYLLADEKLAKYWGQNIANFERFTNEVQIFSSILHCPLLTIGIPKPTSK